METTLLLFIAAFLIYLKTESSSRFNDLNDKFKELNRKLDQLKQTEQQLPIKPVETAVKKPIEKTIIPPIIAPPAVTPPPTTTASPITEIPTPEPVNPIAEKPKTVIVTSTENTAQAKEKVVFSMETASGPKAVQQPIQPKHKPYVPQKSWWDNFKEQNPDLEKFVGENLINKIGVLILVLGISYFVKFAIDKDWINEPARVGIGVLCGALVMAFAHRLRKNYAAFSSVLVAGAIAIFYFTIGIAFHDYHLFSQTVAFIIMVVITAFSSLISLSYNRKELAVLSLIGGFAVPFMVSTGTGNYVVLFTYIIILNIGILAIAYNRKWNIVTIVSYIFTVILYGAWLFNDVSSKESHPVGALAFGFAFYFIFIVMTLINNIRNKGALSVTELTILSSNTFLFYAAGMTILTYFHPEYKGLFTTVLALLNLIYAWFLYKKFGLDKTAVYLLIGLTLTFITLAVPIQFEGNNITLFWAAEAVLLLWLGKKSKITSYLFGAVAVQLLMLISLFMDWYTIYNSNAVLDIVFNPVFITGLSAVASLIAVSLILKKETERHTQFGITFNPEGYGRFTFAAALIIGYCVGLFEVYYQAFDYIQGYHSAMSLPLFFHLLYTTVVAYFLYRTKQHSYVQGASVITIANISIFTLLFSNFPFYEHTEYISTGVHQRMAFYMHYASLALLIYSAFLLYRINKNIEMGHPFSKPVFTWLAAFLIIYAASSELLLDGLVLSNVPVTEHDIQTNEFYKSHSYEGVNFVREYIAKDNIAGVRDQIIRTGFPVLWGILAFIFLIAGIKRQSKPLRIIALALLGITIVKLFLFDIRNASETGKIIAFILLGVLILIISFVYQKIKVLVLDDKSDINNETE